MTPEEEESVQLRVAQTPTAPHECHFFAVDLELAARIKQTLLDHSVPAYLDPQAPPVFRIVAPLAHAMRARTLLERHLGRVIVQELEDTLLFWPPPAQPALLTADKLDADAIDALAEIARGPIAEDRRLAATRLCKLRGFGVETLYQLLAECCEMDDRERGWELVGALSRAGQQPIAQVYLALLRHADSRVRFLAVMFMPRIGSAEGVPLLVGLLRDPDVDVRAEASDALWELTSESIDFDPAAPLEAREQAIGQWEAWLDKWS